LFRVAICDDDSGFRKSVKEIITQNASAYGISCEFAEYSSGESFLADINTVKERDLLIIDILMGGINGMEVARKVRQIDRDIFIIFASSHIKFSPEGYTVRAVAYILKDFFFERNMKVALDSVIPELIRQNSKIMLKTSEGEIKFKVNRLMCAESNSHYVTYYLNRKESYTVREKFSEAAKKLRQYDFIQIHRGCTVNPAFIRSISKYVLVLESDWEINISRDLYKNVEKEYMMYRALHV